MKCLVTGASGFIGSELCRVLRARDVDVVATGREQPDDRQLSGCEVVYHAAGIAHRAAQSSDYERDNHEASLAVAARAAEAGARRFVFLSSVNAGPDAEAYGLWKWRTEEALRDIYTDSDLQVVIIRPALVYGRGAKANLQLLMRAVRRGLPTPPAGPARSLVGLPDLCDALVRLLEVDAGHGQVLVATDGEAYDLKRMHAAFSLALGRRPGRAWLPLWLWRAACVLLDISRRRAIGDSFGQLFGGVTYSNAALCEALDWSPRLSLEDLAPGMMEANR